MTETTLYRSHRPANFDEVVGQETAISELKSLLSQKALPHSMIFVGGRGIGKTTIARIVASELGTAPEDIYELDAASNRGVDDIRELREQVNTLPMRSQFKVYILDEVHMLTPQAWNAFLKTLEEPPAHVKFLMATTELHQVPETIISRSRVIRLQSPTVGKISQYVLDIAKKEGVTLSGDVAECIAVSGNGSFRDSLVSLQTILAQKEILDDAQKVSQVLGVPALSVVRLWLLALYNKDAKPALEIIKQVENAGTDITFFLELALSRVRLALSKRVGMNVEISNKEDEELIATITSGTSPIGSGHLVHFVDGLRLVKSTPVPAVVLEMVTYKICE